MCECLIDILKTWSELYAVATGQGHLVKSE